MNVGFRDTVEVLINLVDPDPDEVAAVYSVEVPGFEVVFFEVPFGAELWEVVTLAMVAFKDFQDDEG